MKMHPSAARRLSGRRRAIIGAIVVAVGITVPPPTAHATPDVAVGSDADGRKVAVATTGSAHSSEGVAVSPTGTASGAMAGVSGTGTASTGYGGTAASGTGDAHGHDGVVATGDGRAYNYGGGGVSASGTQQGYGGMVSVSPAGYAINTGILDVPMTAQGVLAPTTDTVDPADTAAKMTELALTGPSVAWNMAMGATSELGAPAARSSSTQQQCPDGACQRPVPEAFTHSQALIAQERNYFCVPAAVQMFLASGGGSNASQAQLAGELGTKDPDPAVKNDPNSGTPTGNSAAVINNRRRSGDRILFQKNENAKQLMDRVTLASYKYRHGAIIPTNPKALGTWTKRGSRHAIVLHGYDHRGGGWIYIMDPFDMTRFGWDQHSWGGPNPFGSHRIRLGQVWSANEGNGATIVW